MLEVVLYAILRYSAFIFLVIMNCCVMTASCWEVGDVSAHLAIPLLR